MSDINQLTRWSVEGKLFKPDGEEKEISLTTLARFAAKNLAKKHLQSGSNLGDEEEGEMKFDWRTVKRVEDRFIVNGGQ